MLGTAAKIDKLTETLARPKGKARRSGTNAQVRSKKVPDDGVQGAQFSLRAIVALRYSRSN